MIALGNNLGLKVVAEGVQSASQALLLHGWGCHAAQGFHFGKPMPLNAAVKVWNMENRRERGTGVATSAICRPDGFGDTQVRRWTDHESAPNTKQYSRPRVQA